MKLFKDAKKGGEGADTLLAAALTFPGADKAFPQLAASCKPVGTDRQVAENARQLLQHAGKHNKMGLLSHLQKGLPRQLVGKALSVTDSEIRRARESNVAARATFAECNYKHGVERTKTTEEEKNLLVTFFVETTHVLSGAQRETCNLQMTK